MFNIITLLTAITLLFGIVIGQDSGNCISLGNSITCSAFSQFFIGLPGLASDFSFLLNTTTIQEFDERLLAYVNSTSNYLFPLGCLSSNYNPTIPYARYSLTRLCAAMIQNPTYSLPCNFDNQQTPPPLCQTTCSQWVDSVTHITANTRVCADSTQRNSTLASFSNECSTWEGFNGNVSDNCISGIANEPYTCGFGPGNNYIACHYCRMNSNDTCCQNVSGCGGFLSGGAIAGIVIGCLIAIALVSYLAYFFWFSSSSWQRPIKNNPFRFMSSSAAASSSSTTTAHQKEYINNNQIIHESTLPPPLPSKLYIVLDPPPPPPPLLLPPPPLPPPLLLPLPPPAIAVPTSEEFYVVIHHYPPQFADELELNAGDIICLALRFDDGWALGFNASTGLKGVFPVVCVSPAEEESLDQLLNPPPPLQQLKRSKSLNHSHHSINTTTTTYRNNTIPKRSASCYNKKEDDYMEAESPSSPTLYTPFFNNTTIVPPPPTSLNNNYEMK